MLNVSVSLLSSATTLARSPKVLSVKVGSVASGSSELDSTATTRLAVDPSVGAGVVVVVDVLLRGGRRVTRSSVWLSV